MPMDRTNNRGYFPNDAGSPVAPAADAVQAALDAQWWPILHAGHLGTGVVSGSKVQAITGGRTVDVAAGQLKLLGAPISIADTNLPIAPNATTFRRFDLVVYRGSLSALHVVQGLADPIPCFPSLETDSDGEMTDVVLGAVLCRPGFTNITLPDVVLLGVPPAAGDDSAGPPIRFEMFRKLDGTIGSFANNGPMKGPNTSANIQDNIVTDPVTGDQYATFWNANCQPVLLTKASYETWLTYYTDPSGPNMSDAAASAKARVQSRYWHMPPHTSGATDYTGNAPTRYDTSDIGVGDADIIAGHSFISMGIDKSARLHIVGNVHNVEIRYVRSGSWADWKGVRHAAIGDINNVTFGVAGLDQATYPAFFSASDGTLFFGHREGISGDGDTYLFRWNDPGTGSGGSWTNLGIIINGHESSVNAYPHRYSLDDNDDLHLFWEWRQTPNPYNQGVYYAKFSNIMTGSTPTATKADGTPITMPIRLSQAGHTADRPIAVPDGIAGNLINNGGACVDSNGNPHAAFAARDADDLQQIHHVWHDGTAWHTEAVTNFRLGYNNAGNGDFIPYTRVAVVCDNAGKTYLVGTWLNERLLGKTWAWDVSPGSLDVTPFPILAIPDMGEVTYDTNALRHENVLRFLVMDGRKQWICPADESENAVGTGAQAMNDDFVTPHERFQTWRASTADAAGIAAVCTIDLAQMSKFRGRMVELPTIRTVITDGGGTVDNINKGNAALNGVNLSHFQPFALYCMVKHSDIASGQNFQYSARAPRIVVGDTFRGALLFVRHSATFHVTNGVGWLMSGVDAVPASWNDEWGKRQTTGLEGDAVYAPIWCKDGQIAHATKSSAWVPVVNFLNIGGENNGVLGYLQSAVTMDGPPDGSAQSDATGVIEAMTIELGVLEGETLL